MKFSDVSDGTDVIIDGTRYRKTRPWSPQQYNASNMSDGADLPTFAKIKADQGVKLYVPFAWR